MKAQTKTSRENQQNIVLYRLKLMNGILVLIMACLGLAGWKGYSRNTREIQQRSEGLQGKIDRLEKKQDQFIESVNLLISIVNKHSGQIDTLRNSSPQVVRVGGVQADRCTFSNCESVFSVHNKVQK